MGCLVPKSSDKVEAQHSLRIWPVLKAERSRWFSISVGDSDLSVPESVQSSRCRESDAPRSGGIPILGQRSPSPAVVTWGVLRGSESGCPQGC